MAPSETLQPSHDIISVMKDTVAEASAYVRHHVDSCNAGHAQLEAHSKKDDPFVSSDVVTVLDKTVEDKIFSALKKHFPTVAAVGEESTRDRPKDPKDGDQCWVLDSIDGTKNVVNGSDEFSISLALQEFHGEQWETVAGVIATPMKEKLAWAEKGKGAYIRERAYEQPDRSVFRERKIQIRPHPYESATPSDNEILGGRNIAVCLGRVAEPMLMKVLDGIKGPTSEDGKGRSRFESIRMVNSVATDLAMIGNGRAAMVLGGLEEHDKAAGLLFAKEAGALISKPVILKTPDGTRAKPVHQEVHIVASDQPLLDKLTGIVRTAQRAAGLSATR